MEELKKRWWMDRMEGWKAGREGWWVVGRWMQEGGWRKMREKNKIKTLPGELAVRVPCYDPSSGSVASLVPSPSHPIRTEPIESFTKQYSHKSTLSSTYGEFKLSVKRRRLLRSFWTLKFAHTMRNVPRRLEARSADEIDFNWRPLVVNMTLL